MGKAKMIITITGVFMLLFSYGNMPGNIYYSGGSNSDPTGSKSMQQETKSTQTGSKSVQTKTKSTQTGSKSVQTKTKSAKTGSKSVQTKTKSAPTGSKSAPVNKSKDSGTARIGTQAWAVANLNVSTFRNGDSIPEARTNKEWVTAGESGKPAWCYYNNDSKNGPKYGKLYNWFAVNDPRGLAPVGWTLPGDADWAKLTYYLGGVEVAGKKMKSTSGWADGNNGTNETGFIGLPGGYRVENGIFLNLGSIGTWWSSTESKARSAIDYYLVLSGSLDRSSSPKQRGESVRCLRY
jgi:uncharacterized protein (TIGR02145 family)